ncbi:Ribonuclease BN, tRNA processing enzyme [Pilibacter termitis]|uniref:Ribonuclease BN, tRNA processing enzyme n=1 Tax=Pilibacter termitis TaxID=263852 RepID=A0A1T4QA63_9ENTE|nr:MBL fold metallo-hydrolase [Pilibacter termitis]SKA00108.1 Ribonuclease BN, tRNA processing enzyme [Pilibacter termitis]
MKVTVLGCLGGFPHNDEGTSAYLLQEGSYNLLLDCGSRAVTELEHFVSPLCLDAVILSHYHHDHIADLGVLQYYRQLWDKDDWDGMNLSIYGHTEDKNRFNDLTLPNVSTGVAYNPDETLRLGPFDVTFMKTIHPVPCYAMRFTVRKTGKVFVFTGDSGYMEEFKGFAKNADLFLADTYLFEGQERHHAHFTSKESGEIARVAQVKKLVLTHLPQEKDLNLLHKQAQQAAGEKVTVELAKKRKTFEI